MRYFSLSSYPFSCTFLQVLMNPVAGGMCIAPYENMWYRARIRTVLGDRVRVFYVDYGNTETVRISEIRELLPEFREVEFMVSLTLTLTFRLTL